jgi:hypothetical protein
LALRGLFQIWKLLEALAGPIFKVDFVLLVNLCNQLGQ